MRALLILSNFPDQASADRCARELVENGLAACVSVLAPCRSVYTWKGKVETAQEVPLLAKAAEANYLGVQELIKRLHPYELPEIVAVAFDTGLPAYLHWVTHGEAA